MDKHEAGWRRFLELWDDEKYFECHEVLEALWMDSQGDQRLFYQGLIHCAVALYQQQRGNRLGMARQWLRAEVKLDKVPKVLLGKESQRLYQQTQARLEATLQQLTATELRNLQRLREELAHLYP